MNPIQLENLRPGNDDWQLTNPATDREIEGYASKTSYNRGEEVVFYVHFKGGASIGTDCSGGQCPSYSLEVFRMGFYSGDGARRVLGPQTLPGYAQPQPILDSSNTDYEVYGLIECDWAESFRFSTAFSSDADWVSGIYLARLTALGGSSKQSYIIFAIRDDARSSDFLFQQSVTTYQAYNNWPGAITGGRSTYPNNSSPFPGAVVPGVGNDPDGYGRPAVKVSFDRPYGVRNNPSYLKNGNAHDSDRSGLLAARFGVGAGEFLTTLNHRSYCCGRGHEYNFVRFLEREGYDVSYATNIDVARNPSLLLKHKGFLSVGHDEYWSKQLRDNVEAARDAGVGLGFFSANTCFIQVRIEQNERVIVAYKGPSDPCTTMTSATCPMETTVGFRDAPVSRPEHTLLGVAFRSGSEPPPGTPAGSEETYFSSDMVLQDVNTWVTADLTVQTGAVLSALVGYEVDSLPDNPTEWRPGIKVLAASPIRTTATAHMVTFDAESAATIFSTGTIQWSLGLDDFNCDHEIYKDGLGVDINTNLVNEKAKAITRNVLERFRSRNRTDMFGRGGDNAIWWRPRIARSWQPWQPLGGSFISAPAASSLSANRLSLFAIGQNSELYLNVWNGVAWTGWTHLGAPAGHALTSNPAAISRDNSTTDVFVRATQAGTSAIWHRAHDGTTWGAWQSLGGGFSSGPAASSWGADQMLVFAVGLDGALWNKQWIAGTWSDWVTLGGPGIPLDESPAAVSTGVGKVDVFVRGVTDHAIWHRRYSAGWQPWQTLGGGFNSGPGVASWHRNKMTVSAVGLDNKPWLSEWTGSIWTPWQGIDGALTSAPSLISWYGSGR